MDKLKILLRIIYIGLGIVVYICGAFTTWNDFKFGRIGYKGESILTVIWCSVTFASLLCGALWAFNAI